MKPIRVILTTNAERQEVLCRLGQMPLPIQIEIKQRKISHSVPQRNKIEVEIRRAAVHFGCASESDHEQWRDALLGLCSELKKEKVKIGGFEIVRRESTVKLEKSRMSTLIEQVRTILAEMGYVDEYNYGGANDEF